VIEQVISSCRDSDFYSGVIGSNLGLVINTLTEVNRGFSKFLHANVGTAPWIITKLLSSTHFPINLPLLSIISTLTYLDLLTEFLNKIQIKVTTRLN
jgi:hypothetical protein